MRNATFLAVMLVFVCFQSTCLEAKNRSKNKDKSGPGKVQIGVDASVWDSTISTDAANGIFPILGGGQINGEFVVAERNGIQIGIRAQERLVGPIPVIPDGQIGTYLATTGFSTGTRATWNYDWHVDLRNARGVAAGTTLSDYDLYLQTDIVGENETLFGFPVPLDLTFGAPVLDNAVLYQSSQNPVFGNPGFDPLAPGVYHFNLILAPSTFNGPPLVASMRVLVIE